MARKTHFAGFAALAATLTITFASTAFSGANAQQGVENENTEISQLATDETVPLFVSEEVVQPLPPQAIPDAEDAETQTSATSSASSLSELMRQTDTDFTPSREMECLAGAVYFESRGEPLAGQLAVAQVIINRAESDVFPSSYCGVVYQRSQFSFVKNGHMPRIARSSTAWKQAKAIARIAHEGHWQSEARDALYFHARYVNPKWSRRKVARATISTHIFYR
ncbi:MAG: cell wall hydrolase [Pontixanthobacter sp.]